MSETDFLLLILAIFGGIELGAKGVKLVLDSFPPFLSINTRAWKLAADSFTIPSFRRKAEAARIEEVLNQTAFNLQLLLPKGWIRRAQIRWVRNPKAAQLNAGIVVLRVRPGGTSDHNLMQALWIYFHGALFPDCRDLLPDDVLSAVALTVTRASLEQNHQYLLAEFDDAFLPAISAGKQSMLDYFGDCRRLNEYGLLMGPFLREVNHAATNARFNASRTELPSVIKAMLDHMLGFQPFLRVDKPEEDWFYQCECASYAFILVSRPPEIRPGIKAYVKRGEVHVQRKVQHLYVMGRNDEREFMSRVIESLMGIRELKGLEFFSLFRDYRGDPHGTAYLLSVDPLLAKLNLTRRISEYRESSDSNNGTTPVPIPAEVDSESEDTLQKDFPTFIKELVTHLSGSEVNWVPLTTLGAKIRQQLIGFEPKVYGGRNLVTLLKKFEFLEIEERSPSIYLVRLRQNGVQSIKSSTVSREESFHAQILQIAKDHSNEDGSIFLGTLGHYLKMELPDFNHAEFKAASLREFVSGIPELVIDERGEGHTKTYLIVKPAT